MSHAAPGTVVRTVPTVEAFAKKGKCSGCGTGSDMQPEEAIKQAENYIVQCASSHRARCDFASCLTQGTGARLIQNLQAF